MGVAPDMVGCEARGQEQLRRVHCGQLIVLCACRALHVGFGDVHGLAQQHALVAVGAGDERRRGLFAILEDLLDLALQQLAVEEGGVIRYAQSGEFFQDRGPAFAAQAFDGRFRIEAEGAGRFLAELVGREVFAAAGFQRRSDPAASAALDDGLLEKPARCGGRHQRQNANAARRLAEQGDVAWIAAERFDVGLHPFQRGDLVEDAVIRGGDVFGLGFFVKRWMAEKAQHAEAVVEGDSHYVALGERRSIVDLHPRCAGLEGAAMQPDHHGQSCAVRVRGRPYVEREAVLAHIGERDFHGGGLRAGPAVCEGGAHPVPGSRRHGSTPAQGSYGWRGVGQALEDVKAALP